MQAHYRKMSLWTSQSKMRESGLKRKMPCMLPTSSSTGTNSKTKICAGSSPSYLGPTNFTRRCPGSSRPEAHCNVAVTTKNFRLNIATWTESSRITNVLTTLSSTSAIRNSFWPIKLRHLLVPRSRASLLLLLAKPKCRLTWLGWTFNSFSLRIFKKTRGRIFWLVLPLKSMFVIMYSGINSVDPRSLRILFLADACYSRPATIIDFLYFLMALSSIL